MLFSVLIPVYNVEKYLGECIESVLSQDCNDYEIILVDDGSTDSSGAICDEYEKEYSSRIKVIHKKNEGLLMARRDAVSAASGEYYVFLDSDDTLAPKTLSRYEKCIDRYHCDFILVDLYYQNPNGSIQRSSDFTEYSKKYKPDILISDTDVLKKAILTQQYCCWSMAQKCVRGEIAETDFDFRKYKGLQYGEDTLQTLFILNKAKNYVYLDGCFYIYRVGSGMTANTSVKRCADFYEVTDVIKKQCRDWTDRIDDYADIYLAANIVGYIYDLSMTDIRRTDLMAMLDSILGYKDTEKDIKRADALRNDEINLLNVSRKHCNSLLARRKYRSLYLFLMIHRTLRRKYYRQRISGE